MLILYAEDDPEDIEVVCEALKEIGSSLYCQPVSDGRQLFTYLQNTVVLPELILLDINMPMIDGIECLKQLKQNRKYHDIPTVIYTTSTRPEDATFVKKLGALDFITKPSTFQQLVSTLKSLISKLPAKK